MPHKPPSTPSLPFSKPPPISLWPTIFPPTGYLTPMLTPSTPPKQKINALTTVIALIVPSKQFLRAAVNAQHTSNTAFTTPSTIALQTTAKLSQLLPDLLQEPHPIALAKTARLAAELASCGITTPRIVAVLSERVLDHATDRTSRAAAASALSLAVCKGDVDGITKRFSCSLKYPAPVPEMLSVLKTAVMDYPTRIVTIWRDSKVVLSTVLEDHAVGLHAVRLVQAFFVAILEREDLLNNSAIPNGFLEELYEIILLPAARGCYQPTQLSAISAIDAFQQLPIATTTSAMSSVSTLLHQLSTNPAISIQSAALKALGNHPILPEKTLEFLVRTPSFPKLPRAKAVSAAAVLLEKIDIVAGAPCLQCVIGEFVRDADMCLRAQVGGLSKAERSADESLRVASLTFLGAAIALYSYLEGNLEGWSVNDAMSVVMDCAMKGSVNVRVHACKALARVLKEGMTKIQQDVVQFLCALLTPDSPVRVQMASTRALVSSKDLSVRDEQAWFLVERCTTCEKAAREEIDDARARALGLALRRLLGELVVRIIEGMDVLDWSSEAMETGDVYDCIAVYYRLPGFLKDKFESGGEKALLEFPEENRRVVGRLLARR